MNRKRKKGVQVSGRIAKLRKAIRKKYQKFKQGEMETVRDLEKQYKPIISELQKIEPPSLENIKQEPKMSFKKETKDASNDDNFEPLVFSSPKHEEKTLVRTLSAGEEWSNNDDEDSDMESDVSSVLSTREGQETASRYIEEKFQNPLTKRYMQLVFGGLEKRSRSDPIDHTFGPRFEGSVLKIGDKELKFNEEGGIVIGGVTYRGTPGLYELIFKRAPDDTVYTDADKTAYKDILKKTNAHIKNYMPGGNINRNNSNKYKIIINELFPREVVSGRGLMTKTLKGPDTSYWNDPNELVDRLQILVAASQAGNTGVRNEILNILEELREAKLISGKGNAAFQSLLK